MTDINVRGPFRCGRGDAPVGATRPTLIKYMLTHIDKFIEKAKVADAEVELFPSVQRAVQFLKDFLSKNEIKGAIISKALKKRDPFDKEFSSLSGQLSADSIWVDAGIVSADYGIAETGTLIHFDASDEEKNVWTLPETCLCLLEKKKIVPHLEAIAPEIASHLARTDISSPQVSLVTGPSRTADIECQLTIGVHGPARLVILLIGT